MKVLATVFFIFPVKFITIPMNIYNRIYPNFFTNTIDCTGYGMESFIIGFVNGTFIKLFHGEYLSGVTCHEIQYVKFPGCQRNFLAVQKYCASRIAYC